MKLQDLLVRGRVERYGVVKPRQPDVSMFFRTMVNEIIGGNLYPAMPARFAGHKGLMEVKRWVTFATVDALNALRGGQQPDKEVTVAWLGEYAGEFLRVFGEVTQSEARGVGELKRSAQGILERLHGRREDPARAERLVEIAGLVYGEGLELEARLEALWEAARDLNLWAVIGPLTPLVVG